jgi:hypothetical protein
MPLEDKPSGPFCLRRGLQVVVKKEGDGKKAALKVALEKACHLM